MGIVSWAHMNKRIKVSSFLMTYAIVLFTISCATQNAKIADTQVYKRIYLVRHAEKADDSKDPDLSPIGAKRATQLEQILSNKGVDKIYSTNYKRTKQTGTPLAERINTTIEIFDPSDLPKFAQNMGQAAAGTYLIVGHSNSTPTLVNEILKEEKYTRLDHEEYDKLFIVDCDKSMTCKSKVITF